MVYLDDISGEWKNGKKPAIVFWPIQWRWQWFVHRALDLIFELFKAAVFVLLFLSIFIPGSISFWVPNS